MTHRVVLVAFPQVQVLDVAGPAEVFSARAGYDVAVAARRRGTISSSSLGIMATHTYSSIPCASTVIVAGGDGARAAAEDPALLRALEAAASSGARVASVCTGAFVLAAAGVLAGRRATTHWAACSALARLHPDVEVVVDAMYVRDGTIWTSGGVTAGVDLALAMLEQDFGVDAALATARRLVVPLSRPGGQSQFSARLAAGIRGEGPVADLQRWIANNPAADCSIPALAARVAMSERHLQRVFRKRAGMPPGRYVEAVRVDLVRRLLETTDASLGEIARGCGFGTVETLHRAFRRLAGTTPCAYRASFSGTAT